MRDGACPAQTSRVAFQGEHCEQTLSLADRHKAAQRQRQLGLAVYPIHTKHQHPH